jgi:autotransporter passenger strand-loop-strand repeat protein
MAVTLNADIGSVIAVPGQQIDVASLIDITASSNNPTYLVVSLVDRDEYTAASNGNTGTLSGNGHTIGFGNSVGGDNDTVGIVFTYNAQTGQYTNSTYGNLSSLIYTASTNTDDNTSISFFTTNNLSLANSHVANPYVLEASAPTSTSYVGSVSVVTQPNSAFSGNREPTQATPDSIEAAAMSFVGQAWNIDGCWVLASNIAVEAGASLPITSTLLGVAGVASGEWIVAYDGPAGQTGNWQSMVTAGEMVVFETSSSSGHITTVVSGSGSTAMLVDNITYVYSNGQIANPANDGSSNDVIIEGPHAASQEWSQAVSGSVVIYELDCPVISVTTPVSSDGVGKTKALAPLFSASNPLASQAITEYQFYDTGTGGAASDSFMVGNVDEVAHSSGAAITVAASALSSVQLLAGNASGTDTIEVRAFNGSYWGDWVSMTINVTGSVAGAVVSKGSTWTVSSGVADTSDSVTSGGIENVLSGGTITATTVARGGIDNISGGGSAVSTTLSGGSENVFSGGTADATTVLSGGVQTVAQGGTASGTVVRTGGSLVDGGLSLATTVNSGGVEHVNAGGVATGVVVMAGGQVIESGGTASSTVAAGGSDYVSSGGSAMGTTVSSGGLQEVFSGGSASGTTVGKGGRVVVLSGGAASGTTVYLGGSETISRGAVDNGALISGGTQYDYGSTFDDTVLGGAEVVEGGATATSTTIDGGGIEIVSSGGSAVGVTISSGGMLELFANATATGIAIASGGVVEVGSGATLTGYTVAGGATLEVMSGAKANATSIGAGGEELIFAHGSGSGTTIGASGYVDVSSGGTLSTTTVSGGTLELASGAIATAISFTSAGGDLVLDASQSFSGTIAGFASPLGVTEEIDLRDIGFGPGTKLSFTEASNHLSGTLAVSSGSHVAHLTLLGQYTAGQFTLESDGHGGTFVIDPLVSASTHAVVSVNHG